MKVGMEVTGDREVIARLAKLGVDVKDRVRGAVGASAQVIRNKALTQGYAGARITPAADGMGAEIGPLPASEKADEDAAVFREAVEKAVSEVVDG